MKTFKFTIPRLALIALIAVISFFCGVRALLTFELHSTIQHTCSLTEVQLVDGTVVKGRQGLFVNNGKEIGIVTSASSPMSPSLPRSIGFFIREESTKRIIAQGLSSDQIKTVLPWRLEEIERLAAQQEEYP